MNKDEWKELFEQDDTAFLCETEYLAKELLKIAHDLGYKWISGSSFIERNNWYYNKEQTYYNIKSGFITSGRNYTIINVSDLLTDRKPFKLHR